MGFWSDLFGKKTAAQEYQEIKNQASIIADEMQVECAQKALMSVKAVADDYGCDAEMMELRTGKNLTHNITVKYKGAVVALITVNVSDFDNTYGLAGTVRGNKVSTALPKDELKQMRTILRAMLERTKQAAA